MGQAGPLRWRAGRGWIILGGGGELEDIVDIHRAAIKAMSDEAPVVYVPAASARPDAGRERGQLVVEQIEELGGPVGFVAPIFTRADAGDPKNVRRLTQAGLVYLGDGSAQKLVETLAASGGAVSSGAAHNTAAIEALAAAFAVGAVILAEGEAACALGAWGLGADGVIRAGWDWLPDTLIRPSFDDSAAAALREAIKSRPECLGLGIPPGVALALGPENQVQTLSASGKPVTVVLGPRFRT
jgi:cyanophycinase-like exopeptidase